MKKLMYIMMATFIGVQLVGCGQKIDENTIVMVWYPNESTPDFEPARLQIAKYIEEATSKKVKHELTADYTVAIETLASGRAHIAYLGSEGYLQAHKRNAAVLPGFIASGPSGTIEDAVYYAYLFVNKDQVETYSINGVPDIHAIEHKRISFVSQTSTSGFKIPAKAILDAFVANPSYSNLSINDLTKANALLKSVIFGSNHPGSVLNLLSDKVDVAATCDTCIVNFASLTSENPAVVGAEYTINASADAPFNTYAGKTMVSVMTKPVLNETFAFNTEVLSSEDQQKIVEKMTSDQVANDEVIFVPEGSTSKAMFIKEGLRRFVTATDQFYDPLREGEK